MKSEAKSLKVTGATETFDNSKVKDTLDREIANMNQRATEILTENKESLIKLKSDSAVLETDRKAKF